MIINKEYYTIKDNCRKGLLKYLEKAVSVIPVINNPQILDAGCGSGVPTLFLLQKFKGIITAVDPDKKLSDVLREKVRELDLSEKINLLNCSLFDLKAENQFDIITAEGLLNVVGFRKGLISMIKLLKKTGFIIIHDELKDQNAKVEFIEKNDFKILDSFVLNEQIWWEDYYKCLENEIVCNSDKAFLKLFKSDLREIESFKKDPSQFNSIYYVIKRK